MKYLVVRDGPDGEKMYVGFIRLKDLDAIYQAIGPRFFDSNIRYGLGDSEAVRDVLEQLLIDP